MAEKSLSANAVYSVTYKCINVIFPLITMLYVSRVLSAGLLYYVFTGKILRNDAVLLVINKIDIHFNKKNK